MMEKRNGWLRRGEAQILSFIAAFLVMAAIIILTVPNEIRVFSNETGKIQLPFKEVTIKVLPEIKVIPGGQSVGVMMDVKGVLVVGLEEIECTDGTAVNPGLSAGLQIGDSILSIDGQKVDSAEDVQTVLNKLKKDVRLEISRKGKKEMLSIQPVKAKGDGQYKIGVWVRDRTAGLGTMTYYNPENKSFGALGHAITEAATGDLLSLRNGKLLHTRVESVKQGKSGDPGEIRGIFYEADAPWGDLKQNTEYGIFGTLGEGAENPYYPEPVSIGYQGDVEKGKAYLLTTLDGNQMGKYEVEIEQVQHQQKQGTKSFVVHVTDPDLLEKTGGIVQGMSGSPIIQNGKLIGAVTHVFVNDPERGYGVFIQWMLQQTMDN